LPLEWGPIQGSAILVRLRFGELDEFECWCTKYAMYVDYVEPQGALIHIRIYGDEKALTYAKLKWGGRCG
jgi:hypothetical protein